MSDKAYIFDDFEECPSLVFRKYMSHLFTNGTFDGGVEVSVAGGMNVNVATGYVHINGAVRHFKDVQTLSLKASSSDGDRVDNIICECNELDRNIKIKVVQGETSSKITTDYEPIRNDEKYQLVIARINIPKGSTEITSGNITDTRNDKYLCGLVAGRDRELDFTQVTKMFEAKQAAQLEKYTAEFDEWYENTYIPNSQITEEDKANIQHIIEDVNTYSEQIRNTDIPKINNDIATLNNTMETAMQNPKKYDLLYFNIGNGDTIKINNNDYNRADLIMLDLILPKNLGKNGCYNINLNYYTIFALREYNTDGTRTDVFKAWAGINGLKRSNYYTKNNVKYMSGYFSNLVSHSDITFTKNTNDGNWYLSKISITALLKEFHFGANSTTDTSSDSTGYMTNLGISPPKTYNSIEAFNAACTDVSAPAVPFKINSVTVLLSR